MKISYNWLKQYINLNISAEETAKILVNLGLEVESVERWQSVKGGLEGFVIGHVVECSKHPNADKLSCTKVDIGTGTLLNVVCGAPNVAAGQKVIVATLGTKIYNGEEVFEIKKSKIRGEESEGMLCAEDELQLGHNHDGIMVLPAHVNVGTLAKEYFKVDDDWVFEIGLTPNRIDSASHYGVARDLAAFLSQQSPINVIKPNVATFKVNSNDLPITVNVKNTEACIRYSGVSIAGVTVKESPQWLKNRLLSIGLRPINNVVDITNFVLHELGQPLHAFDAAKVAGNTINVNTLPQGSKFTTLDEVERSLTDTDLMICNAHEGMCMAGIFGGLHSGVSESTQNIFLESACFNPVWVRKSARRHGLSTDSSFRFERGTDPNNTLLALKRAALLILELAGGTIASEITDIYPTPVADFNIDINFERITNLIGKDLGRDTIKNILTSLEIKIVAETTEGLSLQVPPYRVDVKKEADIVEELLRVYGYNNIEIPEKLNATLNFSVKPDKDKLVNQISDYLSATGFNEIMANSLNKSAWYEGFESFKPQIVYLKNPLSSDLNCMRQTLLFGALDTINRNINHKNPNLKLYEFGNCYYFNANSNANNSLEQYSETFKLGLFVTGLKTEANWISPETSSTFFTIKAFLNNTLYKLGININKIALKPLENELYEGGLVYEYNTKTIAILGMVKKGVTKTFDIKQDVYTAEVDFNAVLKAIKNHKISYNEMPKFPEVKRDLALLLDKSVTYEQIKKIAEKTERKLLKNINMFDVYMGNKIEEGKKSYAISFTLLDEEKTLTDSEIDKVMDKLIKAFVGELGASIR